MKLFIDEVKRRYKWMNHTIEQRNGEGLDPWMRIYINKIVEYLDKAQIFRIESNKVEEFYSLH